MRYVIIPLLIIGYLYWSYKSIKGIIKEKDEAYIGLWAFTIIIAFIYFSIKYW